MKFISFFVLICVLVQSIHAYPSSLPDCTFPAAGGSLPGATSNSQMGISSVGSGANGGCVFDALPSVANPCQVYHFSLKSTSRLAQAVSVSAGTLSGGQAAKTSQCATSDSKTTTRTYSWRAPIGGTGVSSFRALCGTRQQVLAADAVQISLNASAPQFLSGCPVLAANSGLAQHHQSGGVKAAAGFFLLVWVGFIF